MKKITLYDPNPGDIFESVAGSIYLDSGLSLDAVWRVYYRFNLKINLISHLKTLIKIG